MVPLFQLGLQAFSKGLSEAREVAQAQPMHPIQTRDRLLFRLPVERST
jgi:hypothetical protein